MDERKTLINDLANLFLRDIIHESERQLINENDLSKIDLYIDVCIECLSRVHKAAIMKNFGHDYLGDQIVDDVIDKINENAETLNADPCESIN